MHDEGFQIIDFHKYNLQGFILKFWLIYETEYTTSVCMNQTLKV